MMIGAQRVHFRALASGVPEPQRSATVLFMLQALIDETDSHEIKPRIFLMGGYLASLSKWESLTKAWQAELNRSPRLEYFSFRHAFPTTGRPRGQFRNMTFSERDRR